MLLNVFYTSAFIFLFVVMKRTRVVSWHVSETSALIDFRERCWVHYRLLELCRFELLLSLERYNAALLSGSVFRTTVRTMAVVSPLRPYGKYTAWFTGVLNGRDRLSVTALIDVIMHEAQALEDILHLMEWGRKTPTVDQTIDLIERLELFATRDRERLCILSKWDIEVSEHLLLLRAAIRDFETGMTAFRAREKAAANDEEAARRLERQRFQFELLENRVL